MTRTASALAAAIVLSMSVATSHAQDRLGPPSLRVPSQPTTSPYLNLLGPGGAGYQYYRQVKPEMEFRNSDFRVANQLRNVATRADLERSTRPVPGTIRPTGHTATFMNFGNYFGTRGFNQAR